MKFLSKDNRHILYRISERKLNIVKKRIKSEKVYRILSIFIVFFSLFEYCYNKLTSRLIIPYVELVVTTKCNLKCKDCCNLINYYDKNEYKGSYNINHNLLINDVKKLSESVDYIYALRLIGGEPFLYSDLDILINEISKINNIGVIEVISNGVTMPKSNYVDSFRNNKVSIYFSQYSVNPSKTKKVLKKLEYENIKYFLISGGEYEWFDLGDFKYRERSSTEKLELFENCGSSNCHSILNGKIYVCPRVAHGHDLGILDNVKSSHVDLRSTDSKQVLYENIKNFYEKKYFGECDYCNGWGKTTAKAIQED